MERPAARGSRVVVFGRLPVAGRVKTRLAAGIGGAAAAAFYADCLAHALREAAACASEVAGDSCALHFSNAADAGALADWVRTRSPHAALQLVPQPQHTADLGERLHAAFVASAAARTVVVGSDVPELCAAVLRRALDALADADVVLGPALDGGYYLIALAAPASCLFRGIPWSTGGVLAATLAAARAAGLRVAPLLPTLADIDTREDLAAWLASPAAAAGQHALAASAARALASSP